MTTELEAFARLVGYVPEHDESWPAPCDFCDAPARWVNVIAAEYGFDVHRCDDHLQEQDGP